MRKRFVFNDSGDAPTSAAPRFSQHKQQPPQPSSPSAAAAFPSPSQRAGRDDFHFGPKHGERRGNFGDSSDAGHDAPWSHVLPEAPKLGSFHIPSDHGAPAQTSQPQTELSHEEHERQQMPPPPPRPPKQQSVAHPNTGSAAGQAARASEHFIQDPAQAFVETPAALKPRYDAMPDRNDRASPAPERGSPAPNAEFVANELLDQRIEDFAASTQQVNAMVESLKFVKRSFQALLKNEKAIDEAQEKAKATIVTLGVLRKQIYEIADTTKEDAALDRLVEILNAANARASGAEQDSETALVVVNEDASKLDDRHDTDPPAQRDRDREREPSMESGLSFDGSQQPPREPVSPSAGLAHAHAP